MTDTTLSGPVAHASADGHTIHGVAIGEDDVTAGEHGRKRWPRDVLEPAAETLAGEPFVFNAGDPSQHSGDGRRTVGNVVRAAYEPGVGVVYQARIDDEDVAEQLSRGELEVSIEGSGEEVEEDPETGAAILRGFEFTGIAAVKRGASPSNYAAPGEAGPNPGIAALSGSVEHALDPAVKSCKESVLEDNPGMAEGEAIAICRAQTAADDPTTEAGEDAAGTADVETTMADHTDERMAAIPMPDDAQLLYPSEDQAEAAAERIGLGETAHEHELDGESWYMPGETHDAFAEAMDAAAIDMSDHYDEEDEDAATSDADSSSTADSAETTGAATADAADSLVDDDNTTDMTDDDHDTEALLSRLDERDERIDELEATLADYEDEIEQVKRAYASALVENTDTPLTEDDLVDGLPVARLRERVEDLDDGVAAAANPDVRSGGGDNGSEADAALSAEERERKEVLEARLGQLPENPSSRYKANLRESIESELAAVTGGDS